MIKIGEGVLTWMKGERVSDRYGAVWLMKEGGNSLVSSVEKEPLDLRAVGKKGVLKAKVLIARDSTHIGDIFRGISPETPEVGEVIELGSGKLFSEAIDDYVTVGVLPDDGRSSDWMDPVKLYRAHEQTVELIFEES